MQHVHSHLCTVLSWHSFSLSPTAWRCVHLLYIEANMQRSLSADSSEGLLPHKQDAGPSTSQVSLPRIRSGCKTSCGSRCLPTVKGPSVLTSSCHACRHTETQSRWRTSLLYLGLTNSIICCAGVSSRRCMASYQHR